MAMGMKQWMTFGIKTEGADAAAKAVGDIGTSAKKSEKEVEKLNSDLDKTGDKAEDVGKKGGTGMTKFRGGLTAGVGGLKMLKTAIAATGIGLLVLAIGALVTNFKLSKENSDRLRVAGAALQGVMSAVSAVVNQLGDLLVWAFNSPQEVVDAFNAKVEATWGWIKTVASLIGGVFVLSLQTMKKWLIQATIAAVEFFSAGFADTTAMQKKLEDTQKDIQDTKDGIVALANEVAEPFVEAFNDATDAVKKFTKEAREAAAASIALEQRQIALDDANRKLAVVFAQSRAEIAKLNLIADDTTKTIEARIAAVTEAAEIEANLAEQREKNALIQLTIAEQELLLYGRTEEGLQKVADAQIVALDASKETAEVQTGLLTKVNALYDEQKAKIDEVTAQETERLDALKSGQDEINNVLNDARTNEINAVREKYRVLREDALLNKGTLIGDKKAEAAEIAAIEAQSAQQSLALARQNHQKKTQMATNALGALMSLSTAFASDDEEGQRKAFERNKALGLVSAIINTASSVIGAISPAAGGLGIPAGIPGALMAAASGAAQIATIQKTTFDSAVVEDSEVLVEGDVGSLGSQASDSPQIDLGFLGQGSGSTMQAYVITENVNNQLQASQIVTDQTTL